MTKTALLIGVSKYQPGLNALPGSIRDVEALKYVLKDPTIGDFHEVKILLNPDLESMQSEIETLFTEADRDDLVLLYFSGHGIKDDAGRLYFTTSGTRINHKNQPVKATMVPASFVHDMMNNCRAKRQGIILDCCFSGAFDPNLAAKDDNSIDLKGQLGAEGRVVMASSSHLQLSFGRKENSELSIYTNYLVDGLKTGEADLDEDGVISVRDLHRYVSSKTREHSPSTAPKLITFKDLGFDIVLAKSPRPVVRAKQLLKQKIDLGKITLSSTNSVDQREYLPNFLAPYEALIQDLCCSLSESAVSLDSVSLDSVSLDSVLLDSVSLDSVSLNNSSPMEGTELESAILNIIQDSSEAKFALVLENGAEGTLSVAAQSDFIETRENQQLISALRTKILPSASIESIFNLDHHGIYKKCLTDGKDLHLFFVFIPLDLIGRSRFIVVAGLPENSSYLGDAYGKIISSFYLNCQSFSQRPDLVEAAIIDDLKRDYKFLSLALYNRRFELFDNRLRQMTVYFEPILELDSLSISGWEALARDPQTLSAPHDLFQAAELWGVQFMIELDQYFLRVATEKYREGRKETKQNRTQDILPLSVNVYPESLIRKAYFKTVEKIVKEECIIPGKKLILEISEKISLPIYASDTGSKASWVGFKNELVKYVRTLNVRFAIDDFGVEHASVSQLAGLKPPYIKVDREILFHESRDIIINFVHDLGESNTLDPPSVILEGFDEESPVTLGHLRNIGVNYIQGYIVNKAQPQIYRLSEEKIEELRGLLAVC
jgi:EAL domain-containing protein (putative c-di-GMP-specific phosphodiesterase class I)